MRNIWVLTLFPDYFKPFTIWGVVGRAFSKAQDFKLNLVDLALHSPKGYKGIDDTPFGGGAGMVMRPDVLENALLNGVFCHYDQFSLTRPLVICPMPRGEVWNFHHAQELAGILAQESPQNNGYSGHDFVFIAGRYEGIDERFLEKYVDRFYSLGDFILSGGELAVMAMIDSTLRLVPKVLGNEESLLQESFHFGALEAPCYTRPREIWGQTVPEAYLSGDPKKIQNFKQKESLRLTQKFRPDLLI